MEFLKQIFENAGLAAVIPTDKAAAALINRKPHTLRVWASTGGGPIKTVRINGRLAWRVADPQSLEVT